MALSKRREASQSIRRQVRRVLVGLFIFGVAFLYLRGYLELVRVRYQISVVQKEIEVWEARCEELRRQIEHVSSDEYVEKVAREELGLVKPGEIPFVVAEPSDSSASQGVRERPGRDPTKIRD